MKYQIRSTWLDAIDMRATVAPVRPDTAMVSLCGSLKKPLPKNAPIVTLKEHNEFRSEATQLTMKFTSSVRTQLGPTDR